MSFYPPSAAFKLIIQERNLKKRALMFFLLKHHKHIHTTIHKLFLHTSQHGIKENNNLTHTKTNPHQIGWMHQGGKISFINFVVV